MMILGWTVQMRLRKMSSLMPTPISRITQGRSGKLTYHKKILGNRLGEIIWIEITEEEYDRLMAEINNDDKRN